MKQPSPKSSTNPGSFKGNMEGSGASDMAKSMLPGAFISMEAGANPEGPMMLDNGPDQKTPHAQMGMGQKMRTVTSPCESPYDIK